SPLLPADVERTSGRDRGGQAASRGARPGGRAAARVRADDAMMWRQPSRVQLALVRVLIFLYPPRFRREFGDAMRADFRERLRDASTLRALCDLAASGLREWVAPTLRDRPASLAAAIDRPRAHLWDDLGVDLRGALRGLVRRPASSLAIIAILALG